jgi:hypothetical protein
LSKERAKARAARDAARAAEREEAERRRARAERLRALKPTLPDLPAARRRGPRRYGALPLRVQLGLAFGWLVAQWVFWQVVADTRTRIGLALISLLALPLLVVLLPMKGRRR